MIIIDKQTALIIVDVQNDFCPGGNLAVPEGDQVVPILNKYIKHFLSCGALIFATQDWHPADHLSFREQGGIWPPHCIQNTSGAAFHSGLLLPTSAEIIYKGDHPAKEAYSGFQGTDFAKGLRKSRVKQVLIGGLATDYCVKATVLDGLAAGFEVFILLDAIRGVEVNAGDSQRAMEAMTGAGAKPITFDDLTHR